MNCLVKLEYRKKSMLMHVDSKAAIKQLQGGLQRRTSEANFSGAAAAAVVVYKYATRLTRGIQEPEAYAAVETQEGEDEDYEELSANETDEADAEQQLFVVNQGINLLLATLALMMMPLMWIAVGILTAASTELFIRSRTISDISVFEDKAIFLHDASDMKLIPQQHRNIASEGPDSAEDKAPYFGHYAHNDEEEKDSFLEDVGTIIKRADDLFDQKQYAQTRDYIKAEVSKYPSRAEMWWRLARVCNYLFDENSDVEKKRALAFEGLACAKKAYALDSNSAASNKWMAIMTSTVGAFLNLKEKIAGAHGIREHIQRAIELDPTDATSHNILGQWCLAFADMTWLEKRAAAALFGTPPTSTYEEAVQHFQAAENVSPGFWKKNMFLLAQTYMKMKRMKDAEMWALKAQAVPMETKADEEVLLSMLSDFITKKLKTKAQVENMSIHLNGSIKQRAVPQPSAVKRSAEAMAKSSSTSLSLGSIIAGDASLLMASSGIGIMAFSGVVSVVMVALNDDLPSVTELRLFSPLIVTGSVLFAVGALNSMLRYSNRKANAAPGEIVLPPGHPPIANEKVAEMVELDEDGKRRKRVSKCPLGF
ncbi:unnamed protein product [Peronospora belbahrii]|uniref:Regulator of microtubule dynamics protein 1 n=1 Tax=Peronospora belbahrii TaxID=622444 RepID=A0AAU9L2R5_9STRA|nr:unnamed protein product [Peronospora belbahrii]